MESGLVRWSESWINVARFISLLVSVKNYFGELCYLKYEEKILIKC